jgi:hypothetical protein
MPTKCSVEQRSTDKTQQNAEFGAELLVRRVSMLEYQIRWNHCRHPGPNSRNAGHQMRVF